MNPDSTLNRVLPWLAGIVAVAVLIWHNYKIYPWMLDDAFITFRYAEHLAAGYGPVYNIGEAVEGCTTFLWLLLLAGGKWLGADTVLLSKILGGYFAIATLGLMLFSYRFVKNINRTESAMATIIFGSCGLFTPWLSSGMEVNLFAFLILWSVLLYIRASQNDFPVRSLLHVGGLLALTVITRPDGAIVVFLLFGHALYHSIKSKRIIGWSMVVSSAVIYVPFFLWRWDYYGYLLPNTFYAKVGFDWPQVWRGLFYARNFFFADSVVVILALAGIVFALRRRQSRGLGLLFGTVVIFAVYSILVGGDPMPAMRFMAPALAPLALLAASGIRSISFRPWMAALMTMAVLVFNIVQININYEIELLIRADKVYMRGKEVGLWLKQNVPPTTLLATNTAGSIPYYSQLKTIDMLGLNDEHIAHKEVNDMGRGWAGHEKGDGAYVLKRNPEIIQFASSLGGIEPNFPTDRELYESAEFHRRYKLARVYISSLGGDVYFFIRKDFTP
jgi:hypothetical protein